MFDTLFSHPAVLRCHREGPLAVERAAYLEALAAQGAARGTLLRRAGYCLCIAQDLQRWPREDRFRGADLEALAAAGRVARGRGAAPIMWRVTRTNLWNLRRLRPLGHITNFATLGTFERNRSAVK